MSGTALPQGAPYVATDVVAFTLLVMAALHALLWRRDREPGTGWFAIGTASLALFAATNALSLPVRGHLAPSGWLFAPIVGVYAVVRGLIDYLGLPARQRRSLLWAAAWPTAAGVGLVTAAMAGAAVPRLWAFGALGVVFLVMVFLSAWAARREPKAGHGYVAAVLLAFPFAVTGAALAGADPLALRYGGFLAMLVLSMALLTVPLLRRRRALEREVAQRQAAEAELLRLNSSLELIVAERTAKLQALVAGLESFNRSVSHDLRGTLGGMASLASLAREALLQGDAQLARHGLPLIVRQAADSARLVDALLALAKVGETPLRAMTVDLQALVRQVVAALTVERGASGLPKIALADLPEVHADPDLLKPVFANLIGNAVKFTQGRTDGRIEIGAQRSAQGWTVQVRDNGVGFPAQDVAGLFEPFVRLHGRAFDGHGIGLSIVRRAVECHGGRVWAESPPGGGALFQFTLPQTPPGAGPVQPGVLSSR